MNPLPWLALMGIAIWIVDRVLLWCELRGWISYRRMPRVRHVYGDAVLGITRCSNRRAGTWSN